MSPRWDPGPASPSRVSLWASGLYTYLSNPPRRGGPLRCHPGRGQARNPPWKIARLGISLPPRPYSRHDLCTLAPCSQEVTLRGRDAGGTIAPKLRPRKQPRESSQRRGYLTEARSESSEDLREILPEAVGGALSLDRGSYPYSAERLRLGVLHVDLGPMSWGYWIATTT